MTVKLGMDVHAGDVVVCRQDGGQMPKPPRRLTPEAVVEVAADLVSAGAAVWSCYEAGPCGYTLHRQLEAAGVHNVVVVPRRWDPEGQRVKTDRRDARALCEGLDRYVGGNTTVFSVVRVPTPEQEERRAVGRQRATLVRERQRCVVRGHGLLLMAGRQAEAGWWHPAAWAQLAPSLPAGLRERVAVWAEQARGLDEEVEQWSAAIEQEECRPVPKGVGLLTGGLIEREVLDWTRFANRRAVASYTGLCPSERSSGKTRKQGAITKHGNPRLRHLLVEAVWRLEKWQPDYPPVRRLKAALGTRARKRAAVAAARRLAIDLWRINTGQCPAAKLGLKLH